MGHNRLFILAAILVAYVVIGTADFVLNRYVVPRTQDEPGTFKLTTRHFDEPSGALFRQGSVSLLLSRVAKGKQGMLSQSSLYIALFVAYVVVFFLFFLFVTKTPKRPSP